MKKRFRTAALEGSCEIRMIKLAKVSRAYNFRLNKP